MFISLEELIKNSQAFSLAFSPSHTFQEAIGLLNNVFLPQLCSFQSQNSWLQGRAGDSLLSSSTSGSLTITPSPLCLTHVWQSTAWSQSDLLGGQPGWIWQHQEMWIQPCLWSPSRSVSSLLQCMLLSYLNFLGCSVLVGGLTCSSRLFSYHHFVLKVLTQYNDTTTHFLDEFSTLNSSSLLAFLLKMQRPAKGKLFFCSRPSVERELVHTSVCISSLHPYHSAMSHAGWAVCPLCPQHPFLTSSAFQGRCSPSVQAAASLSPWHRALVPEHMCSACQWPTSLHTSHLPTCLVSSAGLDSSHCASPFMLWV